MPLVMVRNDITMMAVDAVVNAANESLSGGGGVDGAIHDAAGAGLLAECDTLGGCKTGMAKITGGYNLPAKYVIHTVGPVYIDGKHGEKALLESCYRESLALAKEYKCETVAFPLISSGVYGYPKDQALRVAIDVISAFLLENDMTVYIVIFDKTAYKISGKLFSDIAEYIDDNYVDKHTDYRRESMRFNMPIRSIVAEDTCECKAMAAADDLDSKLKQIDESFSQMLLRKIDEKGMTDAECYKKANIDRKVFSRIRCKEDYKPKKKTAVAFAIALELDLPTTLDLLSRAEIAFSPSSRFDLIVTYFITNKIYDIFEINAALFKYGQPILGE